MKLVVFDVKGQFAHFRKFYANSTSLSYEFPPRTVVAGMIAAILGLEKDSYYELFNEERALIAVQIMSPIKRISQTVNYMWVKSPNDLNGSAGRMQIPLEWITHQRGIGMGYVCYRIYFAHQDPNLQSTLVRMLEMNEVKYPVYLGISEALATVELIGEYESTTHLETTDMLAISSVCPVHLLDTITYTSEDGKERKYMRDRIPNDFYFDRSLKGTVQAIYEPNGFEIMAKVKNEVYSVPMKGTEHFIVPLTSD